MTAPVTDDDIVSGTVGYLLDQPDAVAAVSSFVLGGQQVPGIFQHRPWVRMEGSSSTCCVVSTEGGWAAPNLYNTLRFPRLTVNIWADPIRDTTKNVTDPGEVQRRTFATYKVIDKLLHRTGGPEVYFGQLRIISCVRLVEPVIYTVPDGDGLIRSQFVYAVTEG
jgi:hypothetical protein